ncbi:MAG: carboxypeptidase-like regulatory domain-containing protein [Archangium sp.]
MRGGFILLLLVASACGNVQPLTSDDIYGLSRAPKTWLTGTVTRSDSNAPVSDVLITLGDLNASTTVDGLFRFDELSPGTLEGAAAKSGFTRKTFSVDLMTGSNQLDVRLEPIACGGCAMPLICDVPSGNCVETATVTANIVSACGGGALSARVNISGHSTCSNETRGAWQLTGLTPGGPQTLSVGKSGYVVHGEMVTLVSGFNALGQIMLTPINGCANQPADVPCSCTTPDCQ